MTEDEEIGTELKEVCIKLAYVLTQVETKHAVEYKAVLMLFALFCKIKDISDEQAHGFLDAALKSADLFHESSEATQEIGKWLQ